LSVQAQLLGHCSRPNRGDGAQDQERSEERQL
jgi:hypothetical protein